MGGNGSFGSGSLEMESGRDYRTRYSISKNIKVIELKPHVKHGTMPTESHTANRVYVTMKKDGSGVREISRMGKDHKKQWSIHTDVHKQFKHGHVHYWKDGKPTGRIDDLNQHPRLKRLLEYIQTMKR
ncbi:MAG: hypothetical protein IJT97_11385 [Bacteroidaceae bacterium]|nr:hypothetical protein [Bacteroidaceae bacterium]